MPTNCFDLCGLFGSCSMGGIRGRRILKIIPGMLSQAEPILDRLQPVDPSAVMRIFLSIRFATSSPPSLMNDLKTSAQEQLEYMLTEDDDAPLLTADDVIKLEASQRVNRLVSRFVDLVKSLVCDLRELVPGPRQMDLFLSYLTDLLWAFQIAAKFEISREFIHIWVNASADIMKISEQSCPIGELNGIKVKALEVTTKVLEAIAYGTVVLPPLERLHMVKIGFHT